MPVDLRIRLHKSEQLRSWRTLSASLCVIALLVSLCSFDPAVLLSGLGFGLLTLVLIQLDPRGTIIICQSLREFAGQWGVQEPNEASVLPCGLIAKGQLAGVLWLECRLNKKTGGQAASCRSFSFLPMLYRMCNGVCLDAN